MAIALLLLWFQAVSGSNSESHRGNYSSALALVDKSLAAEPANPDLLLRKSIVLYALGELQQSLKILQTLPPSGQTRLYMGLNYRALRDHRSAQKYLEEAWEAGIREPHALYCLIEEDQALGDKTAGLRHFQLFLQHFPDSPWLHVLYANAYFLKDQAEDSRKEYQEALRLDPRLPGVNFRLGYLLYNSGDYTTAAQHFERELTLNPAYSDASLFLGQALRQLGRDDEAIDRFRQAISLDAGSELAYSALATALTDRSDLAGAAETLAKAELAFPADPRFPALHAKILTRLNRKAEALRAQERYRSLAAAQRSRERQVPVRP